MWNILPPSQPEQTLVLACPRIDAIRLWPLPLEQPWDEDGVSGEISAGKSENEYNRITCKDCFAAGAIQVVQHRTYLSRRNVFGAQHGA